ncbi:MAG: T9SS type A sorting domain-containing protein [Sphingobacteriia bacterium]|nr:T9SS type A sorting domain-containing protein [Sphingobacteriia bacterium]
MKKLYFVLAVLAVIVGNSTQSQVFINEYSVSNLSQFTDNYQEYEDWIELFNTSDSPVDLSGYFLSDRPGNPMKWVIPEGTTIFANSFLRFWASGRDLVSGNHYHTNFKLNQTKENPDHIIFSDSEGNILDETQLQTTQLGHSRGRVIDGSDTWVIFTNPTPLASNNTSTPYIGYAEKPQMSVEAGFYDQAQTITITCNDPEVEIRYTTNGDVPVSSSSLYTSPIEVSQTKLVQARSFHDNPQILPGFIEFNTYFINEEHTLPVISGSGNQLVQLLNGNASMYPQGTMEYFNEDKERTNIAYGEYNKHGQDSWVNPQRSIDWITRDEMGYNYAICEKLLPLSDRDEFQRIILRAAGDDNYPGKDTAAHTRDIWTQNLAQKSGMRLDVRKGARCILYANGNYWGVYSIREKVSDHDFTDFYYNQGKYDVQFLMYWGNLWAQYGGQQAIDEWMDLRAYILGSDINNPIVFTSIDAQYDYKSLIDYVIINSFVVCSDWLNWNVGWWRGKNPEGEHQKWGYILWDDDAILGHYINYTGIPGQNPYVPPCFPENLSSYSDPQKHIAILNKLLENPFVYQYYVSRYIDLKNTVFIKDDLLTYLDSITNLIAPEMPEHVSRWGGTMTKWNSNVTKMRNFISERCDYLSEGLMTCYNLTGPYEFAVNADPPDVGIVHLNSLELEDFPFNGEYYGGIDVKLKAVATDPNFEFDYWELANHTPNPGIYDEAVTINLNTWESVIAHFKPKLYIDSLIINEINYKSASWFDTEDWIEFYNPHEYDLNITGWSFKDDNDEHIFTFPSGTIIPSENYLVLCRDSVAFSSLNPEVTNYIGEIDFGLSSDGEFLRVFNHEGILIDTVHYLSTPPWPPQANGGGPTLELIHPVLDNALAENWMASENDYGTPGAMNSLLVAIPEFNPKPAELSITIYPNPATSFITVYCNNNYRVKNGILQIFNSLGFEIYRKDVVSSGDIYVPVNNFQRGLYFVKLTDITSNLSSTGRMVIQ